MNRRLRSIVIAALLAILTAALYVPGLQDTPSYPAGDELYTALTAHSVAMTGRDPAGNTLLFSTVWFQPILTGSVALTLKLLPFSQGTIRLPMVLFGVIDVVLMYLIGKLLFRRELLAIGGAVLLALTPSHFYHSRMALQFQAPLPFILGWLLCLLIYLDRGHRSWLVAAGLLLGIGLHTYLPAYVLMPIFGLFTCGALYSRQEPMNRYAALAAGFVVPAALCLVTLLQDPTHAVGGMLGYYLNYNRDGAQVDAAAPPPTESAVVPRLIYTGRMYGGFFNPRLLFVHGRQSKSLGAMFVLPVAGLLVAALLRAMSRPTLEILLVLGGFLIAPLPAALVGQPEAIHRAAAIVPFGVLLAMMGLQHLWTADTPRARRLAVVAVWGTVIGLALVYRPDLPRGQALIRASTLPLAVTGLAVLLKHFSVDWRKIGLVAVVACTVLGVLRIAYLLVDETVVVSASVWLLTAISLATLAGDGFDRLSRRPILVVTLLAAMSSVFMLVYLSHTHIPRLPLIRPGVMILAMPFICPAAALAVLLMLAGPLRDDRVSRGSAAVAILALVAALLAYFEIDYFADLPTRFVQTTAILTAVVGAALLHRRTEVGRLGFGPITAAVVLTLSATQFGLFYVNYFTNEREHGNPEEIEARSSFETAIEGLRNRVVPAVYLGSLGPVGEWRWRFYALKSNRSDLLPHTLVDLDFKPDRVQNLPLGSVVIVGRSVDNDKTIGELVTGGQLKADVLHGADGTSMFWMLHRSGP